MTRTKRTPIWSYNLLTNVVLFFQPKDAIGKMKLHQVSKRFRRAVKEVAPYQFEASSRVLEEMKSDVDRIRENEISREFKFLQIKQTLPEFRTIQKYFAMSQDAQRVQNNRLLTLILLLFDSFGLEINNASAGLFQRIMRGDAPLATKINRLNNEIGDVSWETASIEVKGYRSTKTNTN